MCADISLPAPDLAVDTLDDGAWSSLIEDFDDASIYQTAAWGRAQTGGATDGATSLHRLSRLVLTAQGRPVCAAQLRITRLPWLPLGVAYLRWGPLWRRRGEATDPRMLQAGLRALRQEYVERRGLCLRVLSALPGDDADAVAAWQDMRGFQHVPGEHAQRTLLLPLSPSLPELRAGLQQKWRNGLNRALRQELTVQQGSDDALFEHFETMHRQMVARKRFVPGSDVAQFRQMQGRLPPAQRMQVLLAWHGEQLAAGLVCSHLGDTGLYLHGATTEAGLHTQAAYLLQWQAIEWLKTRGAALYNLHGIDPVTNPGTYHFKAGLCERQGRDVRYLGTFDASPSPVAARLLQGVQALRRRTRKAVTALRQPANGRAAPR